MSADSLAQGDAEILLARELRKAGLALSAPHVRRRTALAEAEGRFVLLLEGALRIGAADAPLLVECHARAAPVDAAQVRALHELAREGAARAILASTSGFTADALAAAAPSGLALLEIVDGTDAWRSAGLGAGRPPAWFPELVAQMVEADEAGLARRTLLQAGVAPLLLDRLRVPAPASA